MKSPTRTIFGAAKFETISTKLAAIGERLYSKITDPEIRQDYADQHRQFVAPVAQIAHKPLSILNLRAQQLFLIQQFVALVFTLSSGLEFQSSVLFTCQRTSPLSATKSLSPKFEMMSLTITGRDAQLELLWRKSVVMRMEIEVISTRSDAPFDRIMADMKKYILQRYILPLACVLLLAIWYISAFFEMQLVYASNAYSRECVIIVGYGEIHIRWTHLPFKQFDDPGFHWEFEKVRFHYPIAMHLGLEWPYAIKSIGRTVTDYYVPMWPLMLILLILLCGVFYKPIKGQMFDRLKRGFVIQVKHEHI